MNNTSTMETTENPMTAKQAFYIPGKPGIIDTATRAGLGMFSGETLEEIRLRYPGAELEDFDKIMAVQDAFWLHEPKEISAERWEEMLCVLPPLNWRNTAAGETFKLCEFTSGNITATFIRISTRYFEMQNKATLKHEEILKIVSDWLQCKAVSAASQALDYFTEDELEGGCK